MNKFEILLKSHVSKELRNRVFDKVLLCLDKAQAKFGVDKVTKIPDVRYDTKGKTAGWACWNHGNPWIKINPILLNENVERVVNETVPHEVAHIVVNEVYESQNRVYVDPYTYRRRRAIEPHGYEWQQVMRLFGLRPERCHDMDVTTVVALRNGGSAFIYKCGCREYPMTKSKHERIQRPGGWARCRNCRGKLAFDRMVSL